MQPSPNLYSFLKLAEGFCSKLTSDPPGSSRYALGYGCQVSGEELEYWRDREITRLEADQMLFERAEKACQAINGLVKVPLEQHEFDALVSFAYNVGIGDKGFRGSTLLRKLNAGGKASVPEQLNRWHWSGGVPNVLDNRRSAEVSIWRNEPVPGYSSRRPGHA